MILHCTADDISIRSDEQGYELFIETDEGDQITVNIQGIVLDFYSNVQAEIRPYVLEAEDAKFALAPGGVRPGNENPHDIEDSGYALDDPKHPTYHDRMSAIHDQREGK